jgi:hypothetical protein
MNATPLQTLFASVITVALALVFVIALPGCGGGGDAPQACEYDLVQLADGRIVAAPNNCPPVQP